MIFNVYIIWTYHGDNELFRPLCLILRPLPLFSLSLQTSSPPVNIIFSNKAMGNENYNWSLSERQMANVNLVILLELRNNTGGGLRLKGGRGPFIRNSINHNFSQRLFCMHERAMSSTPMCLQMCTCTISAASPDIARFGSDPEWWG